MIEYTFRNREVYDLLKPTDEGAAFISATFNDTEMSVSVVDENSMDAGVLKRFASVDGIMHGLRHHIENLTYGMDDFNARILVNFLHGSEVSTIKSDWKIEGEKYDNHAIFAKLGNELFRNFGESLQAECRRVNEEKHKE